jgi:hypothetical protein
MASPATSPASLYRSSSQNSESSGRSTPPPITPSLPMTASFGDFHSAKDKAFLSQAKYLERAGSVSLGLSRSSSIITHANGVEGARRWNPGHRTSGAGSASFDPEGARRWNPGHRASGAGSVSIDEIQRRFGGAVGPPSRSGSVSSRASVDYGRGPNGFSSVSKRPSVDFSVSQQLSDRESSRRSAHEFLAPSTNGSNYRDNVRTPSPLAPSLLPNSTPTHRAPLPKPPIKDLPSEPSRLTRSPPRITARQSTTPSSPSKSPRKDWLLSPDIAGIAESTDEVTGNVL